MRGQRERRRGVAADRLEQHARRLDADLAQLVDDREAMLLVGDDVRRAYVEAGLGSVARRCAACWNSVPLPPMPSARYCFGCSDRLSGQSRVPLPPARITGTTDAVRRRS